MTVATTLLETEADYFLELCNASAVVTGEKTIGLPLSKHIQATYKVISITRPIRQNETISNEQLSLHTKDGVEDSQAGVLLFTSGTTGSPKGVLHSSKSFYTGVKNLEKAFDLTEQDLILAYSSIYWIGGLVFLLSTLVAGGCVEECSTVFNPAWFWERMRTPNVTYVHIAPPLLDKLAEYYDTNIEHGSLDRKAEILGGLCSIRVLGVGSEFVSQQTLDTWQKLRNGRSLVHIYGTTETHLAAATSWRRTEPLPAVRILCSQIYID